MFERLPGFRDFYPEDCTRRNYLFRMWAQSSRRFGFQEYDAPALEPLELFTAKSGSEIVSQLFNFVDKGGREVSLRPELTPSLARLVGSRANALKRPVKWFSLGENYRYEKQQKGRLRCFYQFNADILGEGGPGADAELISLCVQSLTTLGLNENDFVVRLSDRELWIAYLAALGQEGDDALAVLGIIDKRERMGREATIEKLRPAFGDAAEDVLGSVEQLTALRTLDELRAFLPAQASTAELRKRLQSRLDQWEHLLGILGAFGISPFLRIDLSIVRGLAYYTGFVFELFEKEGDAPVGRALAGGGRYDDLIAKLGYPDMPAVGFGMGDVTVTDLLEKKKRLPALLTGPDLYVIIGGEAESPAAWADIAALRGASLCVDYALKPLGFGKQFKNAGNSGASLALVYGAEELAKNAVRIKDLRTGGEAIMPRSDLVGTILAVLESGLPAAE